MRWTRHVAHIAELRNAYSVLVGKSEGKRLFGRSARRWEDDIKTYLKNNILGCGMNPHRIGSSGGLLRHDNETFMFHKRRRIP
jgi:hypothetical protein